MLPATTRGARACLSSVNNGARRQFCRHLKREKDFDLTNTEEASEKYGRRVQRCYGCFVAYYLKDMYLGEDATYYCEHCKDETMFHFEQFSQVLDLSKLPSMQPGDE
jgi:hypothetical protein